MRVSGMSGNELFCIAQKGYEPLELVVGNSVCSLGVLGGIGAWGRGVTGGEIENVTALISEGRHQAIQRMEAEAEKHGATGVTSVVSDLRRLAGYTEFLSQGTGILGPPTGKRKVFSTAASGMELYCQLDAGYQPIRFAMGNVAYALGLGRGLMGSVRTLGAGEVKEFSQMYNHIRHLALDRLRAEALELGANAVIDVNVRLHPWGASSVELLLTGTASHHPNLPANGVVTSELTGEELWNLAKLGWVPVDLVMTTSVYSLGIASGIGTMFQGMSRGELPQLTQLVYGARENCMELMRQEAVARGGEQVIGSKLSIRELAPGLIEVLAVGTAVRRAKGFEPETPFLLPQAIIVEKDAIEQVLTRAEGNVPVAAMTRAVQTPQAAQQIVGLVVTFVIMSFFLCGGVLAAILE